MHRVLQGFDQDQFLRLYWQQKPLLLRQAIPGDSGLLTPEELAGLACEPQAESRIVHHRNNDWAVQHGPFTERDFQQLTDSDWTLLVQAVDHWLPPVAELLDYFRFIPAWRMDDIMVSYACEGGGVGPHFDRYDVFLIQLAGTREWQLGQHCDSSTPLRPHSELRLLEDFEPASSWQLTAGDILYLPPGVAHWGTALDNQCMTASVGFRAPSQAELLAHFVEELLSHLSEDQRYRDPDGSLGHSQQPGLLNDQALAGFQQLLDQALKQPDRLREWLGCYLTTPKYERDACLETGNDLPSALPVQLYRRGDCRTAYLINTDGSAMLFANGDCFTVPAVDSALAAMLANRRHYLGAELQDLATTAESRSILETLWQQGFFDDE